MKSPFRLFGDSSDGPANKKERKDSSSSAPPQSPSVGWTKFKETNPDEFRTPLKDQQRGSRQRHQDGQQQQQQQHPDNRDSIQLNFNRMFNRVFNRVQDTL